MEIRCGNQANRASHSKFYIATVVVLRPFPSLTSIISIAQNADKTKTLMILDIVLFQEPDVMVVSHACIRPDMVVVKGISTKMT